MRKNKRKIYNKFTILNFTKVGYGLCRVNRQMWSRMMES